MLHQVRVTLIKSNEINYMYYFMRHVFFFFFFFLYAYTIHVTECMIVSFCDYEAANLGTCKYSYYVL